MAAAVTEVAVEKQLETTSMACAGCAQPLTNCSYVQRREGGYCLVCFEQQLAHTCTRCAGKIGAAEKDLSSGQLHWHERCFVCRGCELALGTGSKFALREAAAWCQACFEEQFAERCAKCRAVFAVGCTKMQFENAHWHEQCFCCAECGQAIGAGSFIRRPVPASEAAAAGAGKEAIDVTCLACYEQLFASRCHVCAGVIKQGGVTHRERNFHASCFLCAGCGCQLAKLKFSSQQEQPFCIDCFGKRFAKTCWSCQQPITGFCGTKYVNFEERNWHSDCFKCLRCDKSMVGLGFLSEGEKILCVECGR